jgi:hypothetical protein
VNLKLARWLHWETRFWKWHGEAASKFGLCRAPTPDDYYNEDRVSTPVHLDGPQLQLLWDATTLYGLFDDAPRCWQYMCGARRTGQVAETNLHQPRYSPAEFQGANLRWLFYPAAVEGATHRMSLTFAPLAHDAQPPLIYLDYGIVEKESWLHTWFRMQPKSPIRLPRACPVPVSAHVLASAV